MSKALIISEDNVLTNQIRSSFEDVKWTAEDVSLVNMVGLGSDLVQNKSCSILVVDAGYMHYKSLIEETSEVFRSCARHAPFYMIFKGEYDQIFDSWGKHAKRIFQSTMQPQRATQAIKEIIRLETSDAPRQTYYSPMDSIY